MSQYQYKIVHKPGPLHLDANGLSQEHNGSCLKGWGVTDNDLTRTMELMNNEDITPLEHVTHLYN